MIRSFGMILIPSAILVLNVHGQSSGSIQHDGMTRTYEWYVPSSWSAGQSMPVVFVLHGTTQTGEGIMDISEFNTVAEANDFIVVYPDGVGGSWNTGLVGASTADDMGFIHALIDEMIAQYQVDTSRVFSCGFSAGGYFSYKLACESPRCFAAVASVAGTMLPDWSATCSPTRTVPIMHIHGTADFVVDYGGGAIVGLSVDDVIALWNSANNCAGSPTITPLPNTSILDLSTVERHEWSPCDQGTFNVLLKIDGGGHQWPGTSALLGGLGVINQDIDASEEIWNFFNGHSCQGQTTMVGGPHGSINGPTINLRSDRLHISVPDNGPYQVLVVSAAGQVVHQWTGRNRTEADVSDLAPGVYHAKFLKDGVAAGGSEFVIAR